MKLNECRYGVDPTCPQMFPNEKRKWVSYMESLAGAGLGYTEHKEEIGAETMEAIYGLFSTVCRILESRGQPGYRTLLLEIPAEYVGKLNYLLQYCAEVSFLYLNPVHVIRGRCL